MEDTTREMAPVANQQQAPQSLTSPALQAFEQLEQMGGFAALHEDDSLQQQTKLNPMLSSVEQTSTKFGAGTQSTRSSSSLSTSPTLGSGPRLVVLNSDLRGKVFSLDDIKIAGNWVIGRAPDADICLLTDSVARYHARLRRVQGEWLIEAANAATSLLVNERELSFSVLAPGDLIRLGQIELRFRVDTQALDAGSQTSPKHRLPRLYLGLLLGAIVLTGVVVGALL